jgi:hypothetical protein
MRKGEDLWSLRKYLRNKKSHKKFNVQKFKSLLFEFSSERISQERQKFNKILGKAAAEQRKRHGFWNTVINAKG